MKYLITAFLTLTIFACSQINNANMYDASEMSAMMREMVVWSKAAKATLAAGDTITSVPQNFYDLAKQHGTRNEHEEPAFQAMAPLYTEALKGIERRDSQQYFYNASIQACKSCHAVYCSGPLSVINQ